MKKNTKVHLRNLVVEKTDAGLTAVVGMTNAFLLVGGTFFAKGLFGWIEDNDKKEVTGSCLMLGWTFILSGFWAFLLAVIIFNALPNEVVEENMALSLMFLPMLLFFFLLLMQPIYWVSKIGLKVAGWWANRSKIARTRQAQKSQKKQKFHHLEDDFEEDDEDEIYEDEEVLSLLQK